MLRFRLSLLPILTLLPAACGQESGEAGASEGRNRLADATSPYLQQHATNPVHWYQWGEKAFEAAREQNKPIFLSIGYSTCHWCHVMERESFENEEIAEVMNEHFINIKVDREQRPDVDDTYMTFVQATTGRGGWPMSVWLTPKLEPFVGGTYFPPEDQGGRPGFKSVLRQLARAWEQDEARIREQAGSITERLREFAAGSDASENLPPADIADTAFETLSRRYDEEYGGFGQAPKFPRAANHDFLHHYARSKGPGSEDGGRALEMSARTLREMARGGIYDHLGEGFHRYSVDRYWHIPHYEKMLYDQAQLVPAYLETAGATGDRDFVDVARGILDYVDRRMTHPEGGFYSAEDADSLASPEADHKTEGAFYIWEKKEIDRLLGDRAPLFNHVYGVEPDGNAPEGSDPHGKLTGTNTLIRRHDNAAAAGEFDMSPDEVAASLKASREILFEARSERPRPHLDDKVLTGWNGLMISAYAVAHQQLGEEADLAKAVAAAEFMREHLYDAGRGVLLRSFRDGAAEIDGFAADYAYLIGGLLDLYEASFDVRWLEWADKLQDTQDELFLDSDNGGYFTHSGRDESVLLRSKDLQGGSMPSLNAVSARNLLRLGAMLGQGDRRERARETIRAFGSRLEQMPVAAPAMIVTLEAARAKPAQIVIAGEPGAEDTEAMLELAREHAGAGETILLADGGENQEFLAGRAEFYGSVKRVDDRATAYVCEDFVCQLPTNDIAKFEELLKETYR